MRVVLLPTVLIILVAGSNGAPPHEGAPHEEGQLEAPDDVVQLGGPIEEEQLAVPVEKGRLEVPDEEAQIGGPVEEEQLAVPVGDGRLEGPDEQVQPGGPDEDGQPQVTDGEDVPDLEGRLLLAKRDLKQASVWLSSVLPSVIKPHFLCTGAIIGRRHVLTTSSCISWIPREALCVSQPKDDLSDTKEYTKVLSVSLNNGHDMAVLEVVDNFFTPQSVSKLVEDRVITGDKCVVSGWHYSNNRWQEQTVAFLSSYDCMRQYSSFLTPTITDDLVCAVPEYGNSTSCKESRGWPMVCNGVELTGLFSWTHHSCTLPGVYTSVATSKPWISQVKGDDAPCVGLALSAALLAACAVYLW